MDFGLYVGGIGTAGAGEAGSDPRRRASGVPPGRLRGHEHGRHRRGSQGLQEDPLRLLPEQGGALRGRPPQAHPREPPDQGAGVHGGNGPEEPERVARGPAGAGAEDRNDHDAAGIPAAAPHDDRRGAQVSAAGRALPYQLTRAGHAQLRRLYRAEPGKGDSQERRKRRGGGPDVRRALAHLRHPQRLTGRRTAASARARRDRGDRRPVREGDRLARGDFVMRALGVLASPRVWLMIVGVTAVLALIYYAYLAAVASPEENLKDLPIALVNEDEGGELGGNEVNLGDRIVEKVTDPDSPAADTVEWARPGDRDEALEGIGNNEDEGAEMNGQPMKLGEEVAKRITAPDSPAPPFVQWTRTDDRAATLEGLEEGDFYAAIVLPKDYSQRLASMSGPPTGALPSAAPMPAEMGLLTSPAVRPSTTALLEDAFSSIVGGVSQATSERILDGLSEQGVPVPPGAGAIISDPVVGRVSEADVSAKAGPLPEAPQPAEIEVLTNPSAGQSAALPAQNISTGIVEAVSRATSERLSEAAGERGARLTPEVAAVLGDPVRAEVTEAQPVGPNSGNGQSPFFLAFLANLSALIGGAVLFFGTGSAAKALEERGLRPSRTGLWTVRLLLGLVYAGLVAGVELWVAFGGVGVEHEASTAQVRLFLALAVAAVLTVTILLAAALGPAGIGISAVLFVILGLVSSGGLAPLEALPPFYQAYADWLPLRYVIDGLRSLLFYDGSLDAASLERGWRDSLWFFGGGERSEAAGLDDAVCMIGAYLAVATMLRYLISLFRNVFARRERKEAGKVAETAG